MGNLSNVVPAIRRRIRSRVRGAAQTVDNSLTGPEATDVVSRQPSWTSAVADGPLVRLRDDDRHETFYGTLGPGVDSFEVAPSDPFLGVEFEMVGTVRTEQLAVTAEFETDDGTTFTRRASYEAGERGRYETVPVRISAGRPVTHASISISTVTRTPGVAQRMVTKALAPQTRLSHQTLPTPTRPTPRKDDGPPILFVSIDSLRNDRVAQLGSVVEALGEAAVIPAEPRTQGYATQESHGATFTSLHPGTHGLPHTNSLSTNVPTLSEFLAEQGYRCSACVSTANLDPGFGFGRGFHRYERQEMSWADRAYDVRSQVDTVRGWMEADDIATTSNRFYFLHCFDAHYPYLPPFPLDEEMDLSHELAEKVLDIASKVNTGTLQTDLTLDNVGLTEGELQQLIAYYDAAARYASDQIARLLRFLDDTGVLSEMFVVVAGDHGEEFLERGTLFHNSLYDENISPAVVVKPPADSPMSVPDELDLIDLYPTIADLTGSPIPDHCQGVSWFTEHRSKSRITEQVTDQHYRIAVEQDGLKGIFSWEVDSPTRPTVGSGTQDPTAQYYQIKPRDDAVTTVSNPSGGEALQEVALAFVADQRRSTADDRQQVPSAVIDRLDQLGYR